MSIAATLPLLLPRDNVAVWIGRESGVRGLLLTAFAGAAIPGGPALTFPLAASFGSPDNLRAEAAQEQLNAIATDPDGCLDRLENPGAKEAPIARPECSNSTQQNHT